MRAIHENADKRLRADSHVFEMSRQHDWPLIDLPVGQLLLAENQRDRSGVRSTCSAKSDMIVFCSPHDD